MGHPGLPLVVAEMIVCAAYTIHVQVDDVDWYNDVMPCHFMFRDYLEAAVLMMEWYPILKARVIPVVYDHGHYYPVPAVDKLLEGFDMTRTLVDYTLMKENQLLVPQPLRLNVYESYDVGGVTVQFIYPCNPFWLTLPKNLPPGRF